MLLVDAKKVNMKNSIENLEREFNIEDIIIKFWKDEESRDAGLSSIYIPMSNTLQDIIFEAKKLVDRDGYASVEVICKDECDEEVLYFYDSEFEEILSI
jgi:hypothetical protein